MTIPRFSPAKDCKSNRPSSGSSSDNKISPEDMELWSKLESLGKELLAFRKELESYQAKVRRAMLLMRDSDDEE